MNAWNSKPAILERDYKITIARQFGVVKLWILPF